jgi:hypothetical protein
MRRIALVAALLATVGIGLEGQATGPADWKWRQDTPAPLAKGATIEPGSWVFVEMPPGWHVTTGPGVMLYPAANGDLAGSFSLETEIFLFPGKSQEEYGVFLGGQAIDGEAPPEYLAVVLRRDGAAAVLRRSGGQTAAVADWQRHDAIVPDNGGPDAVKNSLRVDVDAAAISISVNGAKVASVPRQGLKTDGRIGFRVGKDMNLHIATMNVTRKLAPAPVRKSGM